MKGTAVEWDTDMDDLLVRLDETGLSYEAISKAMTVVLGFDVGPYSAQRRLDQLGRPPHKPRGVPFGSQARTLICR